MGSAGLPAAGTASPSRPAGGWPGPGYGEPAPAQPRQAPSGGAKVKARPQPKAATGAPRKAHLVLNRFEPWSVMKFSFVMSLVAFVVLFVAVMVLYWVLSLLGVFDALALSISNITSTGGEGDTGNEIVEWFSAATVLGYTALLGAINVVLITAAATIGAVIYNNVAALVGGVEVTFSESE